MSEEDRKAGKIKFFNQAKGFGFIITDSYEGDLFFHVKNVAFGQQTSDLNEEAEVTFRISSNAKGPMAVDVSTTL
jgi:CspA family cold shock protein